MSLQDRCSLIAVSYRHERAVFVCLSSVFFFFTCRLFPARPSVCVPRVENCLVCLRLFFVFGRRFLNVVGSPGSVVLFRRCLPEYHDANWSSGLQLSSQFPAHACVCGCRLPWLFRLSDRSGSSSIDHYHMTRYGRWLVACLPCWSATTPFFYSVGLPAGGGAVSRGHGGLD